MQLSKAECASITVNNMNPQLREKLIVSEYCDLAKLPWKASWLEQFIIERGQRKANRVGLRGSQLVAVVEYDWAEEEVGGEEGTT